VSLRKLGRRYGLNRLLAEIWQTLRKRTYEEKFRAALLLHVRLGDCLWDIGANVGSYTMTFAAWVGPQGRVVSFEPCCKALPYLLRIASTATNVLVIPHALGDEDGQAILLEGEDAAGTTSIVGSPASSAGHGRVIQVYRADTLLLQSGLPFLNGVKIDVEGAELEVLKGFGSALCKRDLRFIGVEVRFALLERKGVHPRVLEHVLDNAGFNIRWTDPSHLLALRRGP